MDVNNPKFSAGQKVRIARKVSIEDGWPFHWVPSMDKFLNEIMTVREYMKGWGYLFLEDQFLEDQKSPLVVGTNGSFYWPEGALELADKPNPHVDYNNVEMQERDKNVVNLESYRQPPSMEEPAFSERCRQMGISEFIITTHTAYSEKHLARWFKQHAWRNFSDHPDFMKMLGLADRELSK